MFLLLSFSLFAMPQRDFSLLQKQVEDTSFHSDKLSVIRLSAQHNTFTCDQVAQLISSISFSGDQIKALDILAPKIEDPARSFVILNAFSFQSSRQEAQRIISAEAPKESLEEKRAKEEERTTLREQLTQQRKV